MVSTRVYCPIVALSYRSQSRVLTQHLQVLYFYTCFLVFRYLCVVFDVRVRVCVCVCLVQEAAHERRGLIFK